MSPLILIRCNYINKLSVSLVLLMLLKNLKKPIILLNSHRRSGTHFLIDSIRKNFNGAYFPNHYQIPADFNIGSLFEKSDRITNTFLKLINQNNNPVIIKSHLLPEEMDITNPQNRHEELIKEIFDTSMKLHVHRDGKDVLTSLYHFIYPGNQTSFLDFLEEPNDHIVRQIRTPSTFDANRVRYWSYYVSSWIRRNDTLNISYGELKNDFDQTIEKVSNHLQLELKFNPPQSPAFPKGKLFHNIRKKLNHFGLVSLPESSSVRPRKGIEGDYVSYFEKTEVLKFYNSELNAGS